MPNDVARRCFVAQFMRLAPTASGLAYDSMNVVSGYNPITDSQYSPNERALLAVFLLFDFRGCIKGLSFASDIGAGTVKRYLVNGKWQDKPVRSALKLGYSSNLEKYIHKIPGVSYLLQESWFKHGLVSAETQATGNVQLMALEAMENSKQINFVIDGEMYDTLNFPA